MSPRSCSMEKEVREAAQHGAELALALRRLRYKLGICRDCALKAGCPRLELYRQQVEAALMQVSLEWDLEEA